jgi:hypothetical protein
MGVKQGESLSPLLFLFFVNDMHSMMQEGAYDTITLDELQIFLLLFADDTVLFSYSRDGLQMLLDQLYTYCNEWGIIVNTEKTVVMTFKNGYRKENCQLFYNGKLLNYVRQFCYLGVTLNSNGSFYQTQKALARQGMKALFSLNSLFDVVSINISEKIKLFDAMVSLILHYGSEVWGFHTAIDIEKVHIKFLKQILGVRAQTPNNAVYGETGRFPLYVLRQVRVIKYWHKIISSNNSLVNRLYHSEIDEAGNTLYENCWASNVKSLLNNLGFGYLWNNQNVSNIQIEKVIERIHDQFLQSWFSEIKAASKLDAFCQFKTSFQLEKYLNCVTNTKHQKALTRFRCCVHKLAIEEGRHRNVERNLRLCTNCNMKVVENEYHFLLICPAYHNLRRQILPKYYCSWPNIHKFISLLNCQQSSVVRNLAKFVYLANNIRK